MGIFKPASAKAAGRKPATGITRHYHFRDMLRRDIETVLDIESNSFDDPWDEKEFLDVLKQNITHAMVAEYHDKVVGFMLYEIWPTRIRVLNFAVGCVRHGIGQAIIEKIKKITTEQRRCRVILEVQESNLDAQLFLKAMEFKSTGILRGYYTSVGGKIGRDEDAYIFQWRNPVVEVE